MNGHSGGMFFGGGFVMWIVWIVLIAVVIYVIKLIFDSTTRQKPSSEEALEILKKRFAKGEIDEEEFKRRKKQLM